MRDRIRRAQERALTAKPGPPLPPRSAPTPTSEPTIGPMPRGALRQPDPPHGSRKRYNSKTNPCRCPLCRRANTEYMRTYRDPDRQAAAEHARAG